jgi:hypothetical protein
MRENLMESGEWGNTVIMTYSEFGRRVAENANRGTDHGTAAPHFIVGGKVQGGIYGKHPSLKQLDSNKDLIYTTDFHSLYKSIAQDWFKVSSNILQPFSPIEHLRFNEKRIYNTQKRKRKRKESQILDKKMKEKSSKYKQDSIIHYLIN